jgi:hypothetical protein
VSSREVRRASERLEADVGAVDRDEKSHGGVLATDG